MGNLFDHAVSVGGKNIFHSADDHAVLRGQTSKDYWYVDDSIDTSSWNTYPSFEPEWSFKSLTTYLTPRSTPSNEIVGYSVFERIWLQNNAWQDIVGWKVWFNEIVADDYIAKKYVDDVVKW